MTLERLASWPGHAFIALPGRVYLGIVFILACWHKILDPAAFALDVATYQVLPTVLANPIAILLPWIELGSGIALVVGFRARAAALCVCGMMVMFIVALGIALHRGLEIGCGCFASQGLEADPISLLTVFRDLGWLAIGAYVVLLDRSPLGVDRWLGRRAAAPKVIERGLHARPKERTFHAP